MLSTFLEHIVIFTDHFLSAIDPQTLPQSYMYIRRLYAYIHSVTNSTDIDQF